MLPGRVIWIKLRAGCHAGPFAADICASQHFKRVPLSFSSVPTAAGTLTRLAFARVKAAGVKPEPLLLQAGVTLRQINDRDARIDVRNQIRFIDLAASVLEDEHLGFHLSQTADLRELGMLYYVAASARTLGEAFRRLARYASMVNESLALQLREGKDISIVFNHIGVARHLDRHQIEFSLTVAIRLCRHLIQRHLAPARVAIAHQGDRAKSKLASFFGSEIEFNARVDEIIFDSAVRDMPVLSADPYLHDLLIAYAEEAMARRSKKRGTLESQVHNAVAPLLPHGRTGVDEVARQLGMSRRTFSRRLASEGLTFTELIKTLREDLARKYLSDAELPISKIAWLLGYQEVSAFTHAFKRWTGKTPREARAEPVFPERGQPEVKASRVDSLQKA